MTILCLNFVGLLSGMWEQRLKTCQKCLKKSASFQVFLSTYLARHQSAQYIYLSQCVKAQSIIPRSIISQSITAQYYVIAQSYVLGQPIIAISIMSHSRPFLSFLKWKQTSEF